MISSIARSTNHRVALVVTPNKQIQPEPDPQEIRIFVGDTMTFFSNQGAVDIVFERPHVFSSDTYGPDTDRIDVIQAGEFVGRCSVTLDNGEKVGWGKGSGPGGVVGRAEDLG